jgi:hypothetical protein
LPAMQADRATPRAIPAIFGRLIRTRR